LIFVPVGNPGPDFDTTLRPGKNLFTDSLVALDARSGRLRWFQQFNPADDKDWDADVVAAFDTSDGRKLVAEAGKDGVLHVMNRSDGRLKFSIPLTRQLNVRTPVPAGKGIRLCPIAAVQWNGPAFEPSTNTLFMNSIDWCAQAIKGPHPAFHRGQPYLGWANGYGTRDPISKAFGWVNAIDATTGALKWRYRTLAPPLAATTVTAGGLALTGDTAGNLYAIKSGDGRLAARIPVGIPLGAGVITYSVAGSQYVAVAGGITNPVYGTHGHASVLIYGR
jgi:alcohol dehydrogenase (cytochrome c)